MTKHLPMEVIFCLLFLFSATMVKSQTISPVYEVNDTTEFSTLNVSNRRTHIVQLSFLAGRLSVLISELDPVIWKQLIKIFLFV